LLFSRRLFIPGLVLCLASCGFTPVYGPNGAGTALQNQITVNEPQDRDDYWFTQRFEERMGRSANAKYALVYNISTVEQGIAVNQEGNIERYDVLGRATYELRDAATDAVVSSGDVESFTGYSATGTSVASLAAERDARERLMIILADLVVTRLQATFKSAS
jgi:LPS-assembly lipoprotein